MADGDGVVERLFDHLSAYEWDRFGSLLSPSVERIGPMGERVVGREPYVQLMAGGESSSHDDHQRTTWDVHCVAYTADGRSAFARVTAHVTHSGRALQIEETLAFTIDDMRLISRIEVFWRDPRGDRNG